MTINGDTRIIAHVGYPTTTFKSSMIYNPWFESHGINAAVVPLGVRAQDFARAFPEIVRFTNFHGALITMPHKVAVLDLLDEVSIAVKVAGSCNAVRRTEDGKLIGDMFDGEGFVRGVQRNGGSLNGKRLLIVGAGGVGSAIAASSAAAGVAEMALYDVNAEAADSLADRLKGAYPILKIATGSNDPAGFDVVVNATPLGMKAGDPMPLDVSRLSPSAFVGEVVLKQETTAFLAAAEARGCKTQVGIDMLFEQIPAYLEFFGFPPATPSELREVAEIDY
ncbi:MAG TPA: shikimate dehydrogenase [Roseiarcus sp.]|nr:shikimate dehydrogenase [Roseiarcus sp.]